MNKKALIWAISVLGILFLVIGFSIFRLYSETGKKCKSEECISRHYHLVEAVPSDAAIVFFSDHFKDVVTELNDSSLVLRSIFTDKVHRRFPHFIQELAHLKQEGGLKSLSNRQCIVSVHYCGSMVPLLIVETEHSEEPSAVVGKVMELAAKTGLYVSYLDGTSLVGSRHSLHKSSILLVSPSETLLISSRRHMENGNSILDADGFSLAVESLKGEDAIVVSNNYSGKLIREYCDRKWMKYADFFRNFSDWTLFVPQDFSGRSFQMNGVAFCRNGISDFANVLSGTPEGESLLPSILPAQTVSALSLAFLDASVYMERYHNYLDSRDNLSRCKIDNQRLKSLTGVSVEQWTSLLDIREVGRVLFRSADQIEKVMLVRIRKENTNILLKGLDCNLRQVKNNVMPYAYGRYASAAFGEIFSVEEETSFLLWNNWIVSGNAKAVEDFVKLNQREDKLLNGLIKAGLYDKSSSGNCHLFAYASLIEDKEAIRENFSPDVQKAIRRSLNSVAAFPVVLDMKGKEEERLQIHYRSARLPEPLVGQKEPVMLDTVVYVDKGPYPVKNFSTGKMNTLVQNDNLSITLKNEDGKGMWSIPFSHQIGGKVETIDYYANGKLQFLFGAGSSLYLLDRLGRFVKPFPVSLGKEILSGPAVFDFTGAHGYTAIVLFKDNTIGMFNLHGKQPEKWKGISDSDTILKLPELLEMGKSHFWVVRTSRQTLVYPFYGGEPVFRREGHKMLRPDTEIIVKGTSSISVLCHDGKKHTVKLK